MPKEKRKPDSAAGLRDCMIPCAQQEAKMRSDVTGNGQPRDMTYIIPVGKRCELRF